MTDTVSPPPDNPDSLFIRNLESMNARAVNQGDSTSRAALARLRRSLSTRELDLAALRDVGDWLPVNLRNDDLDAYLLTAALFALYQPPSTVTPDDYPSFGKTLRKLRRDLSAGAESLDRRMTALLNADRTELPYRLRQLVQMLKGTGHVPDWLQLLRDLLRWDDPNRRVQRRWARDYWTGN